MRWVDMNLLKEVLWISLLMLLMFSFDTSMVFLGIIFLIMTIFTKPKYEKKIFERILVLVGAIFIIFLLQVSLIKNIKLNINVMYYITVYFGIIIYISINGSRKYPQRYKIALQLALIYYNVSTFYMYSQIGYTRNVSTTGASINFLAAVNVITIPYILYQINKNKIQEKKTRILSVICLIILILGISISGSRAAIITLTLVIICLKKALKLKFNPKILFLLIIPFVAAMLAPDIYNKVSSYVVDSINRIFEIFKGAVILTDRAIIKEHAINEIKKNSIFIGKGDNFIYNVAYGNGYIEKTLAHNFIYEILAHSGFFGLLIFISYYSFIVLKIYNKLRKNKKAMYTCYLVLFSGFMISLSQPFLTSGMLFNFVMFNNIYTIYTSE